MPTSYYTYSRIRGHSTVSRVETPVPCHDDELLLRVPVVLDPIQILQLRDQSGAGLGVREALTARDL